MAGSEVVADAVRPLLSLKAGSRLPVAMPFVGELGGFEPQPDTMSR
ncbi:MAG: hypothetical protein V9F00_06445 [Nocardioides sp.]